jgi:serine/threonine-protein kinase RsbW
MSDVVELTIPTQADLLVLARLTAATVASRAGFDVEEVEDLRLAVDELCISLVADRSDGRLSLQFAREDDRVEVVCTFHPGEDHASATQGGSVGGSDLEDPSVQDLSEQILDALVDAHGHADNDGHPQAWLRKRRARQQA